MIILGIETSCDETAASVVEGLGEKVKVLSNIVSSQIKIHKKYNGVVPEVAAREHILNILPVVNEALKTAGARLTADNKNKEKKIDAIAVTVGPGLITSLLVGAETAKTLAFAHQKPLVAVNHIEGHIYSNFINDVSDTSLKQKAKKINFPAIILTVSGGHTLLVLAKAHGKLKIIGETRDDAAGEAFDKAAKLLGLGYPGGPAISVWAEKFKTPPQPSPSNKGREKTLSLLGGPIASHAREGIKLARPMINSSDFDFSFSGLKTSLLYAIQKDKDWKNKIPEYAFEFQQAVIDVLVKKTIKAAKKYKVKTVCLAGGVSANKELRWQLEEAVKQEKLSFFMPALIYTTDNAAMVATAGYFKARQGKFTPWQKLKVDCNSEL